MKKIFCACAALLILHSSFFISSCSDDSSDENTPNRTGLIESDEDVLKEAAKKLGIEKIDENQDWSMTKEYSVTIKVNPEMTGVNKVMILLSNPYLGRYIEVASTEAKNDAEVSLSYRVPSYCMLLHAACQNAEGKLQSVAFVAGDQLVEFVKKQPVMTETADMEVEFGANPEDPYVVNRPTYIPWNRPDYPMLQQEALLFVPFAYPEGQTSNRPQVKALNNHSVKTDWVGGQVTMTFLGPKKTDGVDHTLTHIGYRVYPQDDPTDVQTYILKDCYDANSDDPEKNYMADEEKTPVNYSGMKMPLVWRDRAQNLKTALPPNMKVDFFVVRYDKTGSYAISKDTLAVTVYSINGRTYLSCEDGKDDSFNDKMFHLEGGIEPAPPASIDPKPEEAQVWTYAFEDKPLADYDMNDCVFRVSDHVVRDPQDSTKTWIDKTKMDITVMALGAERDLHIYFVANNQDVFGQELHDLMGVPNGQVTNTGWNDQAPTVTRTFDKPEGFDYQKNSFRLLVKVRDHEPDEGGKREFFVDIAKVGEDPHGIIVPTKWKWPREKKCISKAYPKFGQWAKDMEDIHAQDWYLYPDEKLVMDIDNDKLLTHEEQENLGWHKE